MLQKTTYRLPVLFTLFLLILFHLEASDKKIRVLFSSLNPSSAKEQLSFYDLYPDTEEGKKALKRAWSLLAGDGIPDSQLLDLAVHSSTVDAMIRLINKQPGEKIPELCQKQLEMIKILAKRLPNRNLKGFYAETEEEVLKLLPEEIDIARGVILSQIDEKTTSLKQLQSYEAMIDMMALQIMTQLPAHATPEEKIRKINTFIFEEMGFRFPPKSKFAKDVDLYTSLPAVLDSRHGVCLGVSILYLSIAQRLDLPLEAVTPPGHIYIRYKDDKTLINIETTARGIHVDNEDYLGIETRKLQKRNLKEVIGLAHINDAAVLLKEGSFGDALKCYEKACPYLPDDLLLQELMGYCYLFEGQTLKGTSLLQKTANEIPDYAVSKSSLASDYLFERADIEAIKTIFLSADQTRNSIIKKREALELAVKRCPRFSEGWQSLGIAWLQLKRSKEAVEALEISHLLNPDDPTTEYYLSSLYLSRMDYRKAREHLKCAKGIVEKRNCRPKALKMLERQLAMVDPE